MVTFTNGLPMGQSIFEFLFKYRPVVFERGDFTFLAPWTGLVVALVLVGTPGGEGARETLENGPEGVQEAFLIRFLTL